MEYRFLGRTGVRVSSLCLGTMAFGGDADEREARAIFDRSRELGINLFDCANVYNDGRAEEILGRLVSDCRDEVLVATKAYFPTKDGPNDRGSSRHHLVRSVEASLRRMKTDRIDLFYLHRWDDATDLEETLRALEQLTTAGKIVYAGVSNFAAWQTARALGIAERNRWAPIVATQPMYNLVKRQAESEIFELCAAERLAVFTYSPVGGGLLSGKYGRTERPPSGRLVDNKMYATRYGDAEAFEVAERFTALAREHGIHPVTLAVAWAASHPAVTAPIVGGRSLAQLEPAFAAASMRLDPDLRATISALSRAPAPATDRNEESTEHNYGTR